MKQLIFLVIALVAISCQNNKGVFTITGSGLDQFNGDSIKIYLPDTTEARGHFTEKALISNGEFKLSGNLANPRLVYLSIYDSEGIYKGWKFETIIEDCSINITFGDKKEDAILQGGSYHATIIDAVKNNSELDAAKKELMNYMHLLQSKGDEQPTDEEMQKYKELANVYSRLEKAAYEDVFSNHTDPIARLFAYKKMRSYDNWEGELGKLEKEIGAIDELVLLRHGIIAAENAKANKIEIKIGDQVKDFVAADLNENEIHLKDVLAQNKLVLVEFWASWCAPCRAEIPHMKEAYEHYHNKGFEIVSFTLDHNMKSWEKASSEEHIPWINVSDLKVYKSPVVQMYGVKGVPANYLVDANGQIIAMHLRGEALDNKLKELLD
ncbi:TlpA disulfide reductase family protein [Carboxylicivirga sp. M1479]|uniref:TlpA disulfide reductase family protein n=1 Tax=Carboxylicivirga sp. M1479 TaxID=2594476 RepID=UPI001178521C|nr:TlpA disulfide reductase family protein [Carboxylicivirga sp. M1479]TRX71422.1 AhpC/TSA family protein [Carboxylicivirga sp. M1479]